MTAVAAPRLFRQYAAPTAHGSALIDPPLSVYGDQIAENRSSADHWDVGIGQRSIASLRRSAREEMIHAAVRYTSAYRDVPPIEASLKRPVVMAGHQPELFHPGVWFKNFALSSVAASNRATAINLIVDNDLCGTTSVLSPARQHGRLTRVPVPFDAPANASVPFEQRWIQDRAAFDSFDQRLSQVLRGVVDAPAVVALWAHARRAADRCQNVGCALAQARHALEGELGLQTLELPMGVVCRTLSFSAFVLSLVVDLPRLHSCYNDSLFEYRRVHGIRSHAHPVPELSEADGWLEAPLWIYGDDDPQRRAAWVRLNRDRLEISDRAGRLVAIDAAGESSSAAEQLFAAASPNFKLRPRALVTTMYARLVLSDIFLHGIGGAKYDQLGDMIIRRFFGIEPPQYGVLSATVLLPHAARAQDVSEPPGAELVGLERQIRDLRFSPERFADRAELPTELLERKAALLAAIPPRGAKADWHAEIDAINRQLASRLEVLRDEISGRLQSAREAMREEQIAASREHPFPVYPLEWMNKAFQRLL